MYSQERTFLRISLTLLQKDLLSGTERVSMNRPHMEDVECEHDILNTRRAPVGPHNPKPQIYSQPGRSLWRHDWIAFTSGSDFRPCGKKMQQKKEIYE